MKSGTIRLLLTACLSTNSFASEPKTETYLFFGLEISAIVKSEVTPVVGVTKKRLIVDSSRGFKKIKHTSRLRYSPMLVKTNKLVEISDFKMSYDYRRRYQLETEAMGDVMRDEMMTESEIGRLSSIRSVIPPRNERRIEELTNEQKNREESIESAIENDEFDSETLVDTVIVDMIMTSPVDVSDAFFVITMQYQSPNHRAQKATKQVSIGKIHYIGDLMADIPSKISASVRIPEGYSNGLKPQIYLLSGDTVNLGTTLSNGLRKLQPDTK